MPLQTSLIFLLFINLIDGLSAQPQQRFEFSAPKMGTEFRLIFYTSDSLLAQNAAQAAFRRIDTLNQIMSDYDLSSEISRLAKLAEDNPQRSHAISADLCEVLLAAGKISKRSKGAFDVSIGPLSRLWRRAFRRQTFPEKNKIEDALALVNYRWVKLDVQKKRLRLKKAGMRLDLGGIAKGYAADEVYRVLQSYNITQALVDGGGDLFAGQAPPGRKGWKVGRKVLTKDSLSHEILYLENQAIASSGDTYRFMNWNGKRYSHIIDPRTGLGTTERRLTTVLASNCMLADALASSASIVEKKRLKKLAKYFKAQIRVIWQEREEQGDW